MSTALCSKLCTICIDEITQEQQPYKLACGHDDFHEDCIMQWLGKSGTCPLCRTRICDPDFDSGCSYSYDDQEQDEIPPLLPPEENYVEEVVDGPSGMFLPGGGYIDFTDLYPSIQFQILPFISGPPHQSRSRLGNILPDNRQPGMNGVTIFMNPHNLHHNPDFDGDETVVPIIRAKICNLSNGLEIWASYEEQHDDKSIVVRNVQLAMMAGGQTRWTNITDQHMYDAFKLLAQRKLEQQRDSSAELHVQKVGRAQRCQNQQEENILQGAAIPKNRRERRMLMRGKIPQSKDKFRLYQRNK